MDSSPKNRTPRRKTAPPLAVQARASHGRILAAPDESPCLDSDQLGRLERSFRAWEEEPVRVETQASRRRILLIFLLIRYTAAKLNEVLTLEPAQDFDFTRQTVRLGRAGNGVSRAAREVPLPDALAAELHGLAASPLFQDAAPRMLDVDPAFVRRKLYERAEACGMPKRLAAPEMIRKARAVELLRNNMPLPAVQMLLGHSSPSLTTAYVSFSADDIRQVTRHFMDRAPARKTSARNTFYGKIQEILQGDIQSRVSLMTMGGERVTTVITNDSLERLGLRPGRLITAEVKAPWVLVQKGGEEPRSTAENRFAGTVSRITAGQVTTEYVVRLADGTELCSVVTTESGQRLALREQDPVWVLFNGFAVVLHED